MGQVHLLTSRLSKVKIQKFALLMYSGASTFVVTSRLSKVKIQNFALLMYSGASTFVVTRRLTKTALLYLFASLVSIFQFFYAVSFFQKLFKSFRFSMIG